MKTSERLSNKNPNIMFFQRFKTETHLLSPFNVHQGYFDCYSTNINYKYSRLELWGGTGGGGGVGARGGGG